VTGTALNNYAVTYTNGSLAIGQAALIVTGTNNSQTYNGAAQTNVGASYSGQQGADAFTISGYATGTNYSATPYADNLSVTGTALSNYAITYANGSLAITQAPLTASPLDTKDTIVYLQSSDHLTTDHVATNKAEENLFCSGGFSVSSSSNASTTSSTISNKCITNYWNPSLHIFNGGVLLPSNGIQLNAYNITQL
jgi:hypothetical protein